MSKTKTVMMPRSLTAENGAKALMIGEFSIEVDLTCSSCFYDEPQPECEVCGGEIHYTENKIIDWTTIKEIYAKAVEALGE